MVTQRLAKPDCDRPGPRSDLRVETPLPKPRATASYKTAWRLPKEFGLHTKSIVFMGQRGAGREVAAGWPPGQGHTLYHDCTVSILPSVWRPTYRSEMLWCKGERKSNICNARIHGQWYGFFLMGLLAGAGISGCAGVNPATPPAARGSAQLQIVPSSVNFQEVVVGQKNTQSLKLSNAGNQPLQLERMGVSGAGFSVEPVSLPLTLSAGESKVITVSYAPLATGPSAGTLTVTPLPGGPVSVPVTGSGNAAKAALSLSSAAVSFGNVSLQATSAQSVTLSNTGNEKVQVTGVSLKGAGFGVANLTPGLTLSPQQSVGFNVWFRPAAAGLVTGTLTISSPALANPVQLAISGTGVTTSGGGTPSTTGSTSRTVTLAWNASTSSVSGYRVYRAGTLGGPYTRITSQTVTGLTYGDSSVSGGSTYYYVVTAINSQEIESGYSNEASVSVPN